MSLRKQLPYYGATHIVEALSAIRGNKVNPAAVRRAMGGAKLLDIMGFSDFLNENNLYQTMKQSQQ